MGLVGHLERGECDVACRVPTVLRNRRGVHTFWHLFCGGNANAYCGLLLGLMVESSTPRKSSSRPCSLPPPILPYPDSPSLASWSIPNVLGRSCRGGGLVRMVYRYTRAGTYHYKSYSRSHIVLVQAEASCDSCRLLDLLGYAIASTISPTPWQHSRSSA